MFFIERANFIICKCLYKQFSSVCFVVELTRLALATSAAASVAKTSSTSEMSRWEKFLSDYVASWELSLTNFHSFTCNKTKISLNFLILLSVSLSLSSPHLLILIVQACVSRKYYLKWSTSDGWLWDLKFLFLTQ